MPRTVVTGSGKLGAFAGAFRADGPTAAVPMRAAAANIAQDIALKLDFIFIRSCQVKNQIHLAIFMVTGCPASVM